MNKTQLIDTANRVIAPIGLLLVLAAPAAVFFLRDAAWAQQAYPYVYSAGALIVFLSRIVSPKTSDFRLKRLYRVEMWIGIIFCVGAFFLFYPGASLRDWLAFTLAGAALQVYTSLAIPARQAKISKEK